VPRTPLRELTTLPRPRSRLGRGIPRRLRSLDLRRLRRLWFDARHVPPKILFWSTACYTLAPALPNVIFILLLLLFSKAHQHKAAGRKTRIDIQNYGCNGNLLCYHSVVEKNRISSLQSHGKALDKECCLPGVFCDSGDTPANLLCELNGHLMPCTRCFYGIIIIIIIIIL